MEETDLLTFVPITPFEDTIEQEEEDCEDEILNSTQPSILYPSQTSRISAASVLEVTGNIIDIGTSVLGTLLKTSSSQTQTQQELQLQQQQLQQQQIEQQLQPLIQQQHIQGLVKRSNMEHKVRYLARNDHDIITPSEFTVMSIAAEPIYDIEPTATATPNIIWITDRVTETIRKTSTIRIQNQATEVTDVKYVEPLTESIPVSLSTDATWFLYSSESTPISITPASTVLSLQIQPTIVTSYVTETVTALPFCYQTLPYYSILEPNQSVVIETPNIFATLTSTLNQPSIFTATTTTTTSLPFNVFQPANIVTRTTSYFVENQGFKSLQTGLVLGLNQAQGFLPLLSPFLSLPKLGLEGNLGLSKSLGLGGITLTPSVNIGIGATASGGGISATGISLPGGSIGGSIDVDPAILPKVGVGANVGVNDENGLLSGGGNINIGSSEISGNIGFLSKRSLDVDGFLSELSNIFPGLKGTISNLGLSNLDVLNFMTQIKSSLQNLIGLGGQSDVIFQGGYLTSTYTNIVLQTPAISNYCIFSDDNASKILVHYVTSTYTSVLRSTSTSTILHQAEITGSTLSTDFVPDFLKNPFISLQTNEVEQESSILSGDELFSRDELLERSSIFISDGNYTDENLIIELSKYTPNNKSNSAGIIAGTVIGTLVVILIVLFAALFFYRKRKRQRVYEKRQNNMPYISPFNSKYFSDSSSKDVTFTSSTISLNHNDGREPSFSAKPTINLPLDMGHYSKLLPYNNSKVSLGIDDINEKQQGLNSIMFQNTYRTIAGGSGARLSHFPPERNINTSVTVCNSLDEEPKFYESKKLISPIEAPEPNKPYMETNNYSTPNVPSFADTTLNKSDSPITDLNLLQNKLMQDTFSQATTIANDRIFNDLARLDTIKFNKNPITIPRDYRTSIYSNLTQINESKIMPILNDEVFDQNKNSMDSNDTYSPISSSSSISKQQNLELGVYRVQHPWRPSRKDELYMDSGENVHVDEVFADGWCHGSIVNGPKRSGMFPIACLHIK